MVLEYLMTGIGILGVIILGVNFVLEASDKLGKNHYTFIILHIVASCCLLAYSVFEKIPLFIVLNSMLIIVGLVQFIKTYKKIKSKKRF